MTPEENDPKPLRIIGTPVRVNGKYILNEYALLGKECGWLCPRCNNEVRITPQQAGEHTFTCKVCNALFQVNVDGDAVTFLPPKKQAGLASPEQPAASGPSPAQPAQKAKPAVGILITPIEPLEASLHPFQKKQEEEPRRSPAPAPVAEEKREEEDATQMAHTPQTAQSAGRQTTAQLLWGGFFSKKKYTLHEGANTIGREDNVLPSDLQFPDPEMSRRSVCIDATRTILGTYTFTLNVVKALNPVEVNGKALATGSSVRLNNGDTITLGKTSLTFKNK